MGSRSQTLRFVAVETTTNDTLTLSAVRTHINMTDHEFVLYYNRTSFQYLHATYVYQPTGYSLTGIIWVFVQITHLASAQIHHN